MKKKLVLHLQMSVSELFDDWPEAIPVFIKHRMACVGCSMSSFETLGDAAKIYGIAPDMLLSDIHRAIDSEVSAKSSSLGND